MMPDAATEPPPALPFPDADGVELFNTTVGMGVLLALPEQAESNMLISKIRMNLFFIVNSKNKI
jgi:hypothetical protein